MAESGDGGRVLLASDNFGNSERKQTPKPIYPRDMATAQLGPVY